MAKRLIIGGASGYWGEAHHATHQLLETGRIDFLVYDYLAEVTMSIMARARAKDPCAGYATDFVTSILKNNLEDIASQEVRIVSNAGGVNPNACATAVRELISRKNLDLQVAVVTGDDLTNRAKDFFNNNIKEMFSGENFPEPGLVSSINVYLGAFPIAEALNQGADIVITGRCVDSAVTLGACIHSFGWLPGDLTKLASGSLAGHLLECGPQATGGNFTDWYNVGDISNIGYPIVEIESSGRFEITKPERTTGLVSELSVGEQMLYEIGDPQAYVLPDVICDFSEVTMQRSGKDRVMVEGARGYSPKANYKVTTTFRDGFRAGQILSFNGYEARRKALTFSDAVLSRARNTLNSQGLSDFEEVSIEISGSRADMDLGYGEVSLKIAVRHQDNHGVSIFLRELSGLGLATPPGMSVFSGGGRPKPSQVVRLFSFLLEKDSVPIGIDHGNGEKSYIPPTCLITVEKGLVRSILPDKVSFKQSLDLQPLIRLAVARSGDKGDDVNIGVIARQAEFLPWIWHALTEDVISDVFSDYIKGGIKRYILPGSNAMNIVLNRVLGGGGITSLRSDPQGKGYAQILLSHRIAVPWEITDKCKV